MQQQSCITDDMTANAETKSHTKYSSC